MTEPLPHGSVIGILGGGQLGRMLSVAASRLGFRSHIFEPGSNPPAGHVAETVTTASYDDAEALRTFGDGVDVITYEFENVPTSALDVLEALAPIRPGRNALGISQDRLFEKQFLHNLGLRLAPFLAVDSPDELDDAVSAVGAPSILKTRRFGYDGKGQVRIGTDGTGHDEARSLLSDASAVLEGFVSFHSEISVIAARDLTGTCRSFSPGENVHVDGILRTTTVPAEVGDAIIAQARAIAEAILESLDYVGVLGVELFVTDAGLVVNEIAPRVHNSGHWTQNGCAVDQFEQHIRAIAGLQLGSTERHSGVVMTNLIGDDVATVPELLTEPHSALHLYGKAETKQGRKMGHLNRVVPAKE